MASNLIAMVSKQSSIKQHGCGPRFHPTEIFNEQSKPKLSHPFRLIQMSLVHFALLHELFLFTLDFLVPIQLQEHLK